MRVKPFRSPRESPVTATESLASESVLSVRESPLSLRESLKRGIKGDKLSVKTTLSGNLCRVSDVDALSADLRGVVFF